MTKRIFLDTEFKNLPWTGHSDLLWVGLADEDGNSWSAINADVSIDKSASEFTRSVVVGRMTPDEPRLDSEALGRGVREFCGEVVHEFWAWCPTGETLASSFDLGESAPGMYERYWDWDLQLLRRVVDPWPPGWPQQLCDLNGLAREVGLVPPPNASAHHPREDALWDLQVFKLADGLRRRE